MRLKVKAKKLIALAMCSVIPMTAFTGCEVSVDTIGSRVKTTLVDRFDDTLQAAQALSDTGLIDATTAEQVKSNINNLETKLVNELGNLPQTVSSVEALKDVHNQIVNIFNYDLTGNGRTLKNAMSCIRPLGGYTDGAANTKPGSTNAVYGTMISEGWLFEDEDDKKRMESANGNRVLSNFALAKVYNINAQSAYNAVGNYWITNGGLSDSVFSYLGNVGDLPIYDVGDDGINYAHHATNTYAPIDLVPDSVAAELEGTDGTSSKFDFPVYVLKPNISGSLNGDYNLSSVATEIQNELSKEVPDINTLNKYFSVAKDDKGNTITLKSILADHNVDIGDLVIESTWNTDGINAPGEDIILTQGDTEASQVPIIGFRVQEFNLETVNKINEAVGIFNDDGKYKVVMNGDTSGAVYLMEYPVYAISDFEITGSQAGNEILAKANYALSGFGINLRTGNLINYDTDSNGYLTSSGTYINPSDPYYTSALFGDSSDNTSFTCVGSSYVPLNLDGKKYKVGTSEVSLKDYELETTRIVLKDYIEAIYTPGFNSYSNVNALGRKVRLSITNFVKDGDIIYNNKDSMARYVDKDGNTLSNADTIKLSDFCDIEKLNGKLNSQTQKTESEVYRIIPYGTESGTKEAVANTDSKMPTIGELKQTTVKAKLLHVYATTPFPGELIGSEDLNANGTNALQYVDEQGNYSDRAEDGFSVVPYKQKQRMWAIALNNGVYDDGLLQSWVDCDKEGANLDWWNNYLETNGYLYRVNKQDIIQYAQTFYQAEMAEMGQLIIMEDVIGDISELYREEDNLHKASVVRTLFLILGWALMCLAMVILVVWAADTNTDLGLDLMGKITFGHWTAVKYESDIPQMPNSEHSYLSFQKVLVRSLILIVVGILLIILDVYAIVSVLIGALGKIAETIEKLIRGN